MYTLLINMLEGSIHNTSYIYRLVIAAVYIPTVLEQTLTIEIAVAFHPLIPLLVLCYALTDWALGFIQVVQIATSTTMPPYLVWKNTIFIAYECSIQHS